MHMGNMEVHRRSRMNSQARMPPRLMPATQHNGVLDTSRIECLLYIYPSWR